YFSSSLKRVQELQKRGNNILLTKINELTNRLNKNDLVLRSIIENKMTRIDLLLKGNLMKLKALNPSSYIDKGYSLVTYQDNKVLSSIDDIEIGEDILIQIKDGLLNASVTKKRRK
ncbi:MAG: exodeoxyribonuclease VII large subunit, partial [Bacilli bacterium]|nr:exodeoxyribonuclease VII large subunit [Bacilli bacterium]